MDVNPFRYSIGTRVRDRLFLRMLAPDKDDRILDAGCGLGYFTDLIAGKASCTGVDMDETCIDHCTQNLRGNYALTDVTRMPFQDGYFSKALCTEVLEHIRNNGTVLDEIHRVLRPGGVLVASVPCSSGVFGAMIKNIGHASVDENSAEYHHYKGFTVEQLTGLLQDHGFKVVDHAFTLVLFTELVMGFTKIIVQLLIKKKIHSQANALLLSGKWYWGVYQRLFPVLLAIGTAEQPLSQYLKGHMLVVKAIKI